jgi:hypothetical protein
MELSLVKAAKVSSSEPFKIDGFTLAWPMELVKSPKLSVIAVNIVASR